ncbi:MAG: 7-cyano-7-deazaguanine synthase [Candidatus Hatepunaea meridiana]|nr:7-cyano-7-deazaguanine synthase [Candidatus Hatepunaea meridiana]
MTDVFKHNVSIKRCSKCVLPSTLPNSDFNEKGECKWCDSGFPNYIPKGNEELRNFLEQNRSITDSADCLVGVSGGKDSSFAAYQLKTKFNMEVEAFTYIHDGTTEFSLQNAKEFCRKLSIKHHILSLPKQAHIRSFKGFFMAWLDSEDPVAAAMVCVACKHLHILGTKLANDRGIPMVVWSGSPYEEPPFIPTHMEGAKTSKSKSMFSLASLLMRKTFSQTLFRRALTNNFFISLYGCLAFRPSSGYLQRRFPKVKHLNFFDYYNWDREEIIKKLIDHTNWSIPGSVVSDWHSDCLFNIFKEYMFQKMYGVSYTDAFLSNQIRYGLMTRKHAMEELIRSKDYYKSELLQTLTNLGLDHIRSKLDLSCFDILKK